jgi:hypothetical protein
LIEDEEFRYGRPPKGFMTWKDWEDFEFEVQCMLLEEREFNRERMRQKGDYHRMAGVQIV